jgi:hypothetical protein
MRWAAARSVPPRIRADHRFRCCTYNLEIADATALPDPAHQLLHRGQRYADVLEADVRHAEVAHLIHQTVRVLDGAVVARQHEDEIHRRSGGETGRPAAGMLVI